MTVEQILNGNQLLKEIGMATDVLDMLQCEDAIIIRPRTMAENQINPNKHWVTVESKSKLYESLISCIEKHIEEMEFEFKML